MENKKGLPRYVKYLISLGIFTLLSFIVLISVYGFKFTKSNISDAIFIPNIIILFMTFAINIGAGNIFNPLKYTAKRLFTRNKTNDKPQSYNDYLEDKQISDDDYKKEPWYLTYASLTLLVIAFILIL